MKNLKPEAAFHVQDEDEVGLLAEQINQVYEQLLATIRSLDEEKEHMLAVEKSKTVFLRSASHATENTAFRNFGSCWKICSII